MVTSFLFSILVGCVLGFLAGLGVGGGSLLVLWLTAVLSMDYLTARSINLLFFLPCACISTLLRCKKGGIELKKLLPSILCGCIAAGIASFFSYRIDLELLKKFFGGLLVITGLRELFYKQKKQGGR